MNKDFNKERDVNYSQIPFTEYMLSLSRDEQMLVKKEIMIAAGVSASAITRYMRYGVRPDMLKRREIARVIRRHSGNCSLTGDYLFPES